MESRDDEIELNNLRASLGAKSGELFEAVYDELRQIARGYLRSERVGHTLQPTALVNEAYLRLSDRVVASAEDGLHLRALAARSMRVLLIDHARKRNAEKRGADWNRLTLSSNFLDGGESRIDTLEFEEALGRLGERDPRLVQIVELRFYGGLTIEEVALELKVSTALVKTDWRLARALLTDLLG